MTLLAGANTNESGTSVDTLLFKSLLSEGKKEQALKLSEDILAQSRRLDERDFETEAWIRMERALLGETENTDLGGELRWCVDRLASVASGSPLHGVSLLNLAAWHLNQGEQMMSLVTLSDISSDRGHPSEIIGLSRLESGRILASIGDFEPAMRHLWIAMRRLSSSEMPSESVVCAIEWLDIALDEIDAESPTMDDRIVDARPRESPGMTTVPSNPNDIRECVELILSVALIDVSGTQRDDLGLVLDASEALNEPKWKSELEERRQEIQDSRLLEALQS
ncbi:MAG: hypothetical protein CL979_00240 [Euryarchaeota archaeon]|nr:hypothetical protein [Euryarchaeota archaeon]